MTTQPSIRQLRKNKYKEKAPVCKMVRFARIGMGAINEI